jgi:hypothetical protein
MTVEIKVEFSGWDEKELLEDVKKQITDQLRSVRCADHHERPTVRLKGTGTKMEWEITGCCETVIEQAQRVLN